MTDEQFDRIINLLEKLLDEIEKCKAVFNKSIDENISKKLKSKKNMPAEYAEKHGKKKEVFKILRFPRIQRAYFLMNCS